MQSRNQRPTLRGSLSFRTSRPRVSSGLTSIVISVHPKMMHSASGTAARPLHPGRTSRGGGNARSIAYDPVQDRNLSLLRLVKFNLVCSGRTLGCSSTIRHGSRALPRLPTSLSKQRSAASDSIGFQHSRYRTPAGHSAKNVREEMLADYHRSDIPITKCGAAKR
jgi:hypothetical protein